MIAITGASSGIGKYLLERYCEEDEVVCGTFNRTVPDADKSDKYYKVNAVDDVSISHWVDKIKNKATSITLINCAGVNYNSFAHKADLKKWEEVVNVNLIGVFKVINKFLPLMREQNFGRIINLSSIVAQRSIPGTSAYAASKAGLWGMTKSIMAENAKYNITINNLNLGYFKIGMINEIPEKIQEQLKSDIPMKKFGDAEDLYKAVNFVRQTSYLNGSSIDINGGLF
jgi:NAD(P)-dependent dehydrogenase (short-subunit alcohol dehydrogenase family)